jgi:FkbM family methyltransferase
MFKGVKIKFIVIILLVTYFFVTKLIIYKYINIMYSFIYDKKKIYFDSVKNDYIANSWKNETFYELKLLEKIRSLNLNGSYVDVGSHHGNHSIYFNKFCNSDKVISIEGNPFNFNYLKKNLTQNKCKNNYYNIIVSDKKDEILNMKYNLNNTGMSKVISSKNNITSLENIISNKTDTLDNLLKNEKNITLIKFDIENYEYNALMGCQSIITKHKPIIIIEIHKSNPHYDKIINFLKKNNYKTDGINYAASPTFIYKCK